MLNLDQRLLACIANPTPREDRLREIPELLSRIKDHAQLTRYAEREGLTGLLYANLNRLDALSLLNPESLERLHVQYRTTARRNLKLSRDLIELLDELDARALPVVLLKGIALLGEVYSDIATRPMGDLDLWVLEGHLREIIEIVTASGYSQDPDYALTYRRDETILDLHTHPLGADRVRSREHIITAETSTLFDVTLPGTFEGRPVHRPERSDQVIYLGLHCLKHNLTRLIWLADLQGLLSDRDTGSWLELYERADELGQSQTVARITFLLETLLAFELPAEIAAHPDRPRVSRFERTLLGKRSLDSSLPEWTPFLFFMPARGSGHRIRNITESLFPRPEVLRQIYITHPNFRNWQLYLARVVQITGWIAAAVMSGFRSLFRR